MADTLHRLDPNCLRRPGSRMAQPFGSSSRRHLHDVQDANSGNPASSDLFETQAPET
jgi:hypothetical protein